MKKYFILSAVITLFGCKQDKLSSTELVTKYYEAFNASEYHQVKPLITDSITIVEGDYVMTYSQESFHEQFKWDSVFQPTYEIIALEEQNDQVIVTVASTSRRYEFLRNNPLTCRHKISFKANKITKFEVLECPSADWNTWQMERDALVSWVSANHPELDGFIHDLSMKGAINYVKAIELYESRKDIL